MSENIPGDWNAELDRNVRGATALDEKKKKTGHEVDLNEKHPARAASERRRADIDKGVVGPRCNEKIDSTVVFVNDDDDENLR